MGKRRVAWCGAVLGLLLAVPASGQQPPESITVVHLVKAKSGMNAQLEAGSKKHMEWHKKQNDTWQWNVYEILTGPQTGQYYGTSSNHLWTDFDAYSKIEAADLADWTTNAGPAAESVTTAYFAALPQLSRVSQPGQPSPMSVLIWFHLKIGQTDEFINNIRKVNEAIAKTNWPAEYAWYMLVNGGETPTFVLVLPQKNWADMKAPEVSFDAMLEKAFGRAEAMAILDSLGKNIHCERNEMIRYRADLSYRPGS